MSDYREERHKQENKATATGIVLTVALHLVLVIILVFSGLDYLYPPPPETSFVIDFTEEKPEDKVNVVQKFGNQPQSEIVDRSKPVELVQRSEAQEVGKKPNQAKEAIVDDFGDVEKYEPEREKPIDNRALFHAADNKSDKDTLAAQTASRVSDALKAGHPEGNTENGKVTGTPNAHLQGRSVRGSLPRPSYSVQESGRVVVSIWVDNYGNVKKAVAGAEGTTVNNKELWNAARNAALEAHFNMSADAPAMQQGTITYVFNLK
jgi:TonB family protein